MAANGTAASASKLAQTGRRCQYVMTELALEHQGIAVPFAAIVYEVPRCRHCIHDTKHRARSLLSTIALFSFETDDQHICWLLFLQQVLDPELFEHLNQSGEFAHFYFCYRWFLLDFKRGVCVCCMCWRRGLVISGVRRINEVIPRRAR